MYGIYLELSEWKSISYKCVSVTFTVKQNNKKNYNFINPLKYILLYMVLHY